MPCLAEFSSVIITIGYNLPDNRLNHISLCLRIQLRDMRKCHVINVIAATTVIMTDTVTLLTISYRMISIITRAFCRKANADSRFVRPSAVLIKNK